QKDAAKKAVDDAQKAADEAKATAAAKAVAFETADKTYDDASVEASRKVGKAQKAKADALKVLDAAKKALADAQEEPGEDDCVDDKNFVTTITGPNKITAGTSGVFNLRVTNKNKAGGLTFEEVAGSAEVFSLEPGQEDYLHLAWSSVNSPNWQTVDPEDNFFPSSSAVKPGGSFDFKLKVTVDAKAKAGDAVLVGDGGYQNKDGACGFGDEGADAEFVVLRAEKPAPGKGTGKGGSTTGGNGNTTQQGGSSNTSVTSGSTGGTLAKTGSSDTTMPFALAGGAAVVLGAGAMVVARRRKAGADV
ncbi:LPXTG cell wall anchor domain-containing protein, partial [Streptomyces sp. NPDC054835]